MGQHLHNNLYPSLYLHRAFRDSFSSPPEWHPDCHLERDALPPRLQNGTQTVAWNETHFRCAQLCLHSALGIPLAPALPLSLAPGAETHETPCPEPPSSMAPGRSQSCPLQVGFSQTNRIGLPHMDRCHAIDCFKYTKWVTVNILLLVNTFPTLLVSNIRISHWSPMYPVPEQSHVFGAEQIPSFWQV